MYMTYDPASGYPLTVTRRPTQTDQYRNENPTTVWYFDPWTGLDRDPAQDPYGLLLQRPDKTSDSPAPQEADPNGVPPNQPGAKLDAGKAPVRRGLLEYFPRACMAVANISAAGASKYTWGGWETVPDGAARYGDAEVRHICKAAIEGEIDPDFGMMHAAHEAWGALARLELLLREKEKRDV